MAETNLITKADLAKAREIDFTLRFKENVKKLVEALGVTRKICSKKMRTGGLNKLGEIVVMAAVLLGIYYK